VGNHFQSFSSIWIITCYVLLLKVKNKKTSKPKIVQPKHEKNFKHFD
jgi:dipeptide/tripeptide permease